MQCEINEVEYEISDNGMWNQWRWDVKLMTMGCEINDDWDENIMCTPNFEQEILKEHGFQNKVKLIEYINTEGKHIGIDTFSLIIEKYNICVYIWNDNEINGKKWIIINKKQNESQENLFLNYKDYKDK